MSPRLLALAALLLGLACWWFSPWSPRTPAPTDSFAGTDVDCPLPPAVAARQVPLQTGVPTGIGPFRLPRGTLTPLAGFSVEARVLSRRDYEVGREADFSPTDLALGWQRMRDDEVLSRLTITQSSRWYHYRWQGSPPLPPQDIVRSSANMHLIPSNEDVASALRKVREDDNVRIDGWLVQADAPDGWRWRSSTTREDSGDGSCEVIYVCAIRVE